MFVCHKAFTSPGKICSDGSTTGDANNVKFRYDTTYMQMAADGAL